MSRLIRIAGSLLIVVGVGLLAWAITVWQWQDPVTAVVNRVEQRELAESLERSFENRRPVTGSDVASAAERRRALELEAGAWRRAAKEGDAIAKLRIERLDLDAVVVNGTRSSTLKRGPGRYLGSAMPGQGELVYIAGHRDDLRRALLADRPSSQRRQDLPRAALRHLRVRRHGFPDRRLERALGASLERPRAARSAGVPSSLLRLAPVHRLREADRVHAAG